MSFHVRGKGAVRNEMEWCLIHHDVSAGTFASMRCLFGKRCGLIIMTEESLQERGKPAQNKVFSVQIAC